MRLVHKGSVFLSHASIHYSRYLTTVTSFIDAWIPKMTSSFYYRPSDSIDLSTLSNIVLFQKKNLGDAALALPLIQALLSSNPNVQISVICSEAAQPLFKNQKRVKVSSKFGLNIFGRVGEADLCIDLHGHAKFRVMAKLAGTPCVGFSGDRGGARFLTHSVSGPKSGLRKKVFQNLDILRRLGSQPNVENCFLLTKEWLVANSQLPSNVFDRYVIVHPGSRWMFKSLGQQQWREVVRRIILDLDCGIIVTGGNTDMELRLADSLSSIDGVMNFVGKTNISELLGLINGALGYLGVDTFSSHLGSLLEVPGVVVFGPSDSRVWGPIETSPLKIFRLYKSDLSCIPCNLDGCGGGKASQCLLDIQPIELVTQFKHAVEARA